MSVREDGNFVGTERPDTDIDNVSVPDDGWIQIAHGHIFYPMDPRPEDVFIEDIAQSLSRQIRYNGHSDKIITVAQHSCNCAWLADTMGHGPDVQIAMLMHDAGEYIVGDMIRPIKAKFPDFIVCEDSIMAAVANRFNLPGIKHKLMKYFDNIALAWEKRDMYESAREWPNMPDVPDWCPTMVTWSHEKAEHRFIQLFEWFQLERKSTIKTSCYRHTGAASWDPSVPGWED